jgi:hypothetical protein
MFVCFVFKSSVINLIYSEQLEFVLRTIARAYFCQSFNDERKKTFLIIEASIKYSNFSLSLIDPGASVTDILRS